MTARCPLSALADLVDLAAERRRKRNWRNRAQTARSENLLNGPFARRAPANVITRATSWPSYRHGPTGCVRLADLA